MDSLYQSQDITELAKALLNVQRHLQPAAKDSDNPFTRSRYASLKSVMDTSRDALLDSGIWLCQYPVPVDMANCLELWNHHLQHLLLLICSSVAQVRAQLPMILE